MPSFRAACDGREMSGSDVTAAWYHQPPIIGDEDIELGPAGCVAVATSLHNYWMCALETFDCEWLNSPAAVHTAGQKLRQLAVASMVGLPVPQGICGTDPELIRAACNGPTVAKNIADLHLSWGEDPNLAFLTRAISVGELSDGQISSVPVLYQEKIDAHREYRVVVVGAREFAAAIEWKDRSDAVDVRTSARALGAYSKAELTRPTANKLHCVLDCLRLRYCSADFVEGADGVVRLLDLNACGAWWWVDDLYQGEISRAIAAELIELSRSERRRGWHAVDG